MYDHHCFCCKRFFENPVELNFHTFMYDNELNSYSGSNYYGNSYEINCEELKNLDYENSICDDCVGELIILRKIIVIRNNIIE